MSRRPAQSRQKDTSLNAAEPLDEEQQDQILEKFEKQDRDGVSSTAHRIKGTASPELGWRRRCHTIGHVNVKSVGGSRSN